MAAMGECRGFFGWSGGKRSICCRTSVDALRSTQCSPSLLTATLSWVRGIAFKVPARTPRQLGQPQFHWGNPPPAAEPRTRMRISAAETPNPSVGAWPARRVGSQAALEAVVLLAVEIVLVRVDLSVHLHFDESRH